MLHTLLTSCGHEVLVAHSGEQALERASAFAPVAGLLDIGMPGMSGYELAAALPRNPHTAAMFLVAITGWGQEEDRRRALAAGFEAHMTKPADPEAILSLLAERFARVWTTQQSGGWFRMKKFAIGCGIALLLTGIAAAGVAFYVYRQVSSTFTQFAELGKVPEIEREVRNKDRFEPPTSEELTETQVAKLVQVQTTVKQRLGERMNMLEAKYKDLTEKKDASVSDAPAILRAYADLAVTWLEAKRTQVEALNAAGLSLEEYRWIRDQAYRALGMPFMDFDLGRLAEDARRGVTSEGAGQLRGAIEPAGPESNRARVAPVKQQLTDNIALASFGL